ncbi:PASTA domain-containing protein [Candidatus Dependentiae bacterium]
MQEKLYNFKFLLIAAPFFSFILGYGITKFSMDNKKVKIPNVTGKSVQNALKKASSVGLNTRLLESVISNDVPSGTVLSQIPNAGSTVKTGSILFLRVAQKAGKKSTPRIIGQNDDEISRDIELDNFVIKKVCLESTCPENRCFAQYPQASSQMPSNEITAFVSNGPDRRYFLPNFEGKTVQETSQVLEKFEIQVSIEKDVEADDLITEQRPLPNSLVDLSKPLTVSLRV